MSLIETLAETQYAVTWNESSQDERGFLKDPELRRRYGEIQCRRGTFYEFSPHEIAWRIGDGTAPTAKFLRRLLRNKPKWLNVSVSCMSAPSSDRDGAAYEKELRPQGLEFLRPDEDEAVVTFDRKHFREAAKLAGAKRRPGPRKLTAEHKARAVRNLGSQRQKNASM